jgi:DNA-binding NarL/FixJ family response regulator
MARRRYDLVVLCDADFDFVQDGCRRDDGFRQAQQNWTLARLDEMGVPCLRVHGSPAERVGQVLQALDSSPFPSPILSPRSLRAPPKTLLVEDHAMVRESLLLLLDQRLPGYRWREAGTLAAALRLLQNEPDIDLLLLDLDLPDSRGLDTLKRLREAAPQVSAVVLSAHDDRDSVLAAIDHGAAGFLSKTVDAAQLVDGVRRVLEGGVVLPAVLSRSADAPGVVPELSERQRDVLRLLIAGHPNKLIGRALGLSDATVKTHLQLVYRKLQVESRTQAVLAAARWRIRL